MSKTSMKPGNPPALAAFSAASAALIGHALQISNGYYESCALAWLTAGILTAWAGLIVQRWTRPGNWEIAAWGICIGVIVWQVEQNLNDIPMASFSDPWVMFLYHSVALPIMAIAVLGAMLLQRARKVLILVLLIAHFVTGVYLLHNARDPHSDVLVVGRIACRAMLNGQDPYTIDFPDIYDTNPNGPHASYPPGSVINGRVQYGYAYMPLSFAFAMIGHVFGGDFRLGNLLALTAAGGFLAYCGGGLAVGAAGLLLLSPKAYFVISFGDPEPVVILCLAAVVFLHRRRFPGLAASLGLLIVSKQYMPLALLAMPLLIRRNLVATYCKAAVAAAVVTLPLVLWNVQAFWHSAVELQLRLPFHADALNWAAWWVQSGHAAPPQWLPFVAALIALAIAMWLAPRNSAGFAIVVALAFLAFFGLAKQAYCHYYLFTIGALCGCVAAADQLAMRGTES